VHLKDKREKEEIKDCVYKIPCGNCEKTYIGETGRKFGTRLKEHDGGEGNNKQTFYKKPVSMQFVGTK